jgi:hypothetical protein
MPVEGRIVDNLTGHSAPSSQPGSLDTRHRRQFKGFALARGLRCSAGVNEPNLEV